MRMMRWETRFSFSTARSIVQNRGGGAVIGGGQVRDRMNFSELSAADHRTAQDAVGVLRARGGADPRLVRDHVADR